jgi:hypothetical protein
MRSYTLSDSEIYCSGFLVDLNAQEMLVYPNSVLAYPQHARKP